MRELSVTRNALPEVLFVVADRFDNFAANPSVITLRAANSALSFGKLAERGPVTLHPGMGVDDEDWAKLQATLDEHDLREAVTLADPPPAKLSPPSALKALPANVLVANLRDVGPRTFRADLVISSDTEMILDHTAERQHIPGMLLMEAGCQMLGAVTERILSRHRPGQPFYCVMQHFEIDFYSFVFPLPAYLELTVEEWDRNDEERPSFTVTIDVRQGETLCSRAHWRYRAFLPSRVFSTEARKATTAIAAQVLHTQNQESKT